MKLEMDVIAREVVTPSSPTPPHLNNYKLSFIDKIMPPLLMPIVLFYPTNGNLVSNFERSNHLKKSLSKALNLFYPLAGRLVGNSYVNCNDEGVTYVEAHANRKLFDVITDPIPEELSMLLPCDPNDGRDLCLVVQATFFCCGGLAIGVGVSHRVADAFSIFMFVNSWAAFSRGDKLIPSPKFESAVLFPSNDSDSDSFVLEKKENIITKKFVFSSSKISQLKDKYTNKAKDEALLRLTRIETLSAFIWTRFLVATGAEYDKSKLYGLHVFVDIRTRVVPPLSEYHFGNMIIPAIMVPTNEEGGYDVVKKTREAIRDVDGYSVAKLRPRIESMYAIKDPVGEASERDAVMFRFSSLCSVPLHAANFGWGIPVWIGGAKMPISNMVFFMNSLVGGAIDAWVNLKEEDMTKFEADKELFEYVSSEDDAKVLSRM